MDITSEENTLKITLTNCKGLDPVAIYLEQYKGSSKLTVTCYGEAGTAVFSTPSDIVTFISECNADYLARKLCHDSRQVIDYEAVSEKIECHVGSEYEISCNEEAVIKHYGDDWMHNLPYTDSRNFTYWKRIAQAVIESMKHQPTFNECMGRGYTNDMPTKPGWYWCRNDDNGKPAEFVCHIFTNTDDDTLWASWMTAPGEAKMIPKSEWSEETKWQGPITPTK